MNNSILITELETRLFEKNISYPEFFNCLEKIQVIEHILDLEKLKKYYETGDVIFAFANYYTREEYGETIKVIPRLTLKETIKKLNQLKIIYQLKYE